MKKLDKALLELIKEVKKKYPDCEVSHLNAKGFHVDLYKNKCCNNDDPDDMCDNCDCWKRTRANCS